MTAQSGKNLKNRAPELLSPAGSHKALAAALDAGADAVYFGGSAFNARINAANFDEGAIVAAIAECHANGARAYITVNTQLYDREVLPALKYAAFLYESGADALIVADLGFSALVKKHIPDFELHASTQMTAHSASAARLLKEIGFSRMVCARELSETQLRRLCAESPLEIEMFVHGAYCVSVSGQCEFSAMIGKRSGNRGLCAQPCRMAYNGRYPLSLKDLCLAPHITKLIGMGAASLKIEGRMKPPGYVYGITSIYRRLLDERRDANDEEMTQLAALFSRGGFTDGYFAGKVNRSMLGIRSEADKENSREAKEALKRVSVSREPLKAEKRSTPVLPDSIIPREYPTLRNETPKITAEFLSEDQIPQKYRPEVCLVPLERYEGGADGVILPPIIPDNDLDSVRSALESAAVRGAKYVSVTNIGQLDWLPDEPHIKKNRVTLLGSFRLNVFNSETLARLYDMGISCCELSPELTLPQLRDIKGPGRVIVYGRVPLMLCAKKIGAKELKDRKNVVFPVIESSCGDIVYNSVVTYMGDRRAELRKYGLSRFHFIFSDESRAEAEAILEAYRSGLSANFPIRRI
ncbi:MAG: U32 family peptidase [Eubacteriales bacterium]|jgi:collagenase-like PrtC family protease